MLDRADIALEFSDTEALFGGASGGPKAGPYYDGLTTLSLTYGSVRAAPCACQIHVSTQQIRGRGLSDAIGALDTITGIEAPAQTSLFELWYDQSVAGGAADIRVGRQAADEEFMVSRYAGGLVNASFGWPTLPASDLPAGGPSYPFAMTGIRLAVHPSDRVGLRFGIYDSNQDGAGFSLRGGALTIAELVLRSDPQAALPTTIMLGGWYDSNDFADQYRDTEDLSLASPRSNGMPRLHHGDFSFYAMIDQALLRTPTRRIGGFARVMAAPSDRNPVAFFADAGISVQGPLPGRPDDNFSAGFGYAWVSRAALTLAADQARKAGLAPPDGRAETIFELSYDWQATPRLAVQPDVQYLHHPGAGMPDYDVARAVRDDVLVLGVVTHLAF
ncbi:MAG: carbohydrate porin [Rhodospirillales bacterium]|nr:carbohydrate porin [Rhodospirillales bacterium]